ncbi:hypothetical protein NDN08_006297 [Rhodosorus marinus]|uniref:O-acyltransferase WSD1 C-terminal domain-containing protein n=1 Tax=Rhodosorus marinus TaxID=101924 RepID=A0AAV8UKF1_9RHOD|nr:hypothetical protein NDN08_006297 [Rhodosorus marinus]
MIVVLAVVVSIVAVILGFVFLRKRNKADDLTAIRRKMSFTSRSLYENTFPAEAEIMSIINVELVMSRVPSKDEFVSRLMELYRDNPQLARLRSRVEQVGFRDYRFTELKDLKDRLLQVVHVEVVRDDDAMSAIIEKVAGTGLPLDGLLHSYYLIQNQAGHSAVLFRFHHALGDAMGLIDSFSSTLALEDGSPLVLGKPGAKGRKPSLKPGAVLKALVKLATLPFVSDSKTVFTNSSEATGGPLKRLGARRFARTPPFSLEYIKAIKNSFGSVGCTVNDVLTAVLGAGLKKYVQETTNGQPSKLRAMMPVVLPRKKPDTLRNRWCFVSVDLHSQIVDPIARLLNVHNDMEVIKASGEALLQLTIQSIGGVFTSLSMKRQIISNQFASHSVIFSNVPGPPAPVKLCGIPVEHIYAPFPNVRLQVIALSYKGEVTVTFCADEGMVPNPDRLIELFMEELEALGSAANISSSERLLLS